MNYLKTLAIACVTLFALTACDNEDEGPRTYSQDDMYGTWAVDQASSGGNEAQGIEVLISESRLLTKVERVINPENNEIIEENSHSCFLFDHLSVDDEVEGHFEFHGVVNLSYPSNGAENIEVELMDEGQRAHVTTKFYNDTGGLTLVEYEVERVSDDIPTIDETSCASQE